MVHDAVDDDDQEAEDDGGDRAREGVAEGEEVLRTEHQPGESVEVAHDEEAARGSLREQPEGGAGLQRAVLQADVGPGRRHAGGATDDKTGDCQTVD